VNLDEVGADGFPITREVADLLHISDPTNIAGFGPVFRFPFQTIESVIPLSNNRLVVPNDNNYPFSAGRVPGNRIRTSSSSSSWMNRSCAGMTPSRNPEQLAGSLAAVRHACSARRRFSIAAARCVI
jgi:hypothetical protein